MLRASMVMVVSGLCLFGGSANADDKACASNADCAATEFCDSEASASCGDGGHCSARGINVMCVTTCDPVCGCDGKVYDNECWAHKAGASVAYVGTCTSSCSQSK
jgi:hypothetical protein